MLQAGVKCEIEALNSAAQRNFLSSLYLPWKLQNADWV